MGHIGHSVDGYRKNSNCIISWLRWFNRTEIQILLDYVKRFKKDSKHNDVIQIKGLANTDTSTWLHEFLKVYLNKYLAGQENEACIGKLDFEVNVIKAKSSNKDIDTNACSILIPDSIHLLKLPNYLQNWNYVLVQG